MLNSLMRTVVPALYLLLIHLGLAHGIAQPWELNVISIVVLAAVYLLLRVLEQRWRFVGILLGWIGAPSYDQPTHDAVDQAETDTRDELGSLVKALAWQLGKRVDTIVAEHTARQTADITAALKSPPLVDNSSASSVKPAAKKAAPVKKAAVRKPPALKPGGSGGSGGAVGGGGSGGGS